MCISEKFDAINNSHIYEMDQYLSKNFEPP